VGSDQPRPALENVESRSLQISGNSTRLALWDAKLGYQKKHAIFRIGLDRINAFGGLVPLVDVIVYRRYPIVYMESIDGKKIFRTEREEDIARREHDVIVSNRFC
jgi:hypothetical protein